MKSPPANTYFGCAPNPRRPGVRAHHSQATMDMTMHMTTMLNRFSRPEPRDWFDDAMEVYLADCELCDELLTHADELSIGELWGIAINQRGWCDLLAKRHPNSMVRFERACALAECDAIMRANVEAAWRHLEKHAERSAKGAGR